MFARRRVIGLVSIALGVGIIFSMFITSSCVQSVTGVALIIIGYFLMKCW